MSSRLWIASSAQITSTQSQIKEYPTCHEQGNPQPKPERFARNQ